MQFGSVYNTFTTGAQLEGTGTHSMDEWQKTRFTLRR
jgi:hypothetical protein